MSKFNNTSAGGKLSALLGLSFLCLGAQQAAAIPSGPLGCGGTFGVGGCAPYAEIQFSTGTTDATFPSGNVYEYDSSALGYTASGVGATVQGSVDLATGTLKAFASGSSYDPNVTNGGYVIATGVDVFTLHGLASAASFTVTLNATGTGSIALDGYSGQVIAMLGVPGGGGGPSDNQVFQRMDSTGAYTTPFDISLTASEILNLPVDVPFSLSYALRANTTQGTVLDLSHTALLSFSLPDGVTITSMGGFGVGQVGETTVPEPASLALFGLGLAGLGFARRRTQ